MQQHSTIRGLVIREVDFGDHDRYITVLTAEGIKIEVLCRGVRRKGARMANAVRLFCYTDFTLYTSRKRFTLNDAALVHSFWELTQDIERYALACYFAELAALLSDAHEEHAEMTQLMLYAFWALCGNKKPLAQIKAALELRMLALSGYAPQIEQCGACGKDMTEVCFSVAEGVAACQDCARRIGGDWKPISGGVYAAMRHILTCDIAKVFSFALGQASVKQLAVLCEVYTQYHAEWEFDSLKLYHSLQEPLQITKSGAET